MATTQITGQLTAVWTAVLVATRTVDVSNIVSVTAMDTLRVLVDVVIVIISCSSANIQQLN